jgi:hypothetical protein
MAAKIESLIEGEEAYAQARDAVAAILAIEIANQQALATAGGEDPALWALDVYSERSDPVEQWLQGPSAGTPFANVWLDTVEFPGKNSSVSPTREGCTIQIDCHGYASAGDDGAGGFSAGDTGAAKAAHRAAGLVRQILDSGHYTYLGSARGADQWCYGARVSRLRAYQPDLGANAAQHVQGVRVTLDVRLNQTTPQVTGETLEILDVTGIRADGKVLLRVQVDNSP